MPRVQDERTITEAQFQREVNAAIADTEAEVFEEAMGNTPLDNDGDRSLEEMGEGLEGDELDDEDVREDVDTEVDDDVDEALEDDQEEDDDDRRDEDRDDGRDARADQARADRDRDDRDRDRPRRESRAEEDDRRVDQRRREREERGDDDDRRDRRPASREERYVPAWRQRQEASRRREVQGEAEDLRARLAITEARLNDAIARQNAGDTRTRQTQDVEPDMFADPEGWKAWNNRQVEARAGAIADQRLNAFRQETQQQQAERVNANFHAAATRPGLAGLEFNAAYQTLTSLDPRDPQNRALVAGIFHAPDPARALAEWFEDEGYAREFRQDIARDLRGDRPRNGRGRDRYQGEDDYGDRGARRGARDRDYDRDDRGRGAPRHETRRRFVPSLNSAAGGGSATRSQDPELYDQSEASILRYAMR